MTIPAEIQEVFFETLHGNKSVLEFEEWFYADKTLDSILVPEAYLELISYGYKGDKVKYGLDRTLEKLIDKGGYEKWKLLKLLHKALLRDKDIPQILMTFCDLYCKGYRFLNNLSMGYGFAVKVPYQQAHSWEELTLAQQQRLLDSFYPQIEYEISQVISWLLNEEVILTGIQQGEYNYYEFIDRISENDKGITVAEYHTGNILH